MVCIFGNESALKKKKKRHPKSSDVFLWSVGKKLCIETKARVCPDPPSWALLPTTSLSGGMWDCGSERGHVSRMQAGGQKAPFISQVLEFNGGRSGENTTLLDTGGDVFMIARNE